MPAPKGNNFAEGNDGGRPTKYLKKYVAQAYKLCLLGATDEQLADFFEVAESTIYEWKNKHKEFSEAIKEGKKIADCEVAHSLFQRAVGYNHMETKVFQYQGKIITKRVRKQYPPDTQAIKYWLNNRQKEHWREKVEFGITDNEGNDVLPKSFNVNINGNPSNPVTQENGIEEIEKEE